MLVFAFASPIGSQKARYVEQLKELLENNKYQVEEIKIIGLNDVKQTIK